MPEILSTISNELAATVAAAGPGVVRVEGRRRMHASGIVWAEGVIVTAHHVIESDEGLRVGLADGRTVSATLAGRDPTTDLAVLRVPASDLQVPAWSDGEGLKVGHLVLALGRPGETVRATLGIVSALGESWRTPAGGRLDRYVQTDIVMYPGFSGGPLVDVAGRVIGLNTSALLRGVSLAVPTATLRRIVETLLAQGRIRRAYLGIGAQPARLSPALAQQLGQETGLLLVAVEPGSPADRSGLIVGDVIVALDGQAMRQMDDLFAFLGSERIGTTATARLLRAGQLRELTVQIGERS